MLPDYAEAKRTLRRRLDSAFQRQVDDRMVIAKLARRQRMHEGHEILVKREDGSEERSGLTEVSAGFEVDTTDLEDLAPQSIWGKMQAAAEEMASAHAANAIQGLHDVVTSSGNVFDAAGRPMSAELWLEVLEKYPLDFGARMEPILPTLMIHPSRSDLIKRQLQRLEDEPALAERFRGLIERKRDEWRARESHRKLVD